MTIKKLETPPRYVKASSGRMINFDRACCLMDQELLREAQETAHISMEEHNHPESMTQVYYRSVAEKFGRPYGYLIPESKLPQWIWESYIWEHLAKYGTHFEPDVSLTWDE